MKLRIGKTARTQAGESGTDGNNRKSPIFARAARTKLKGLELVPEPNAKHEIEYGETAVLPDLDQKSEKEYSDRAVLPDYNTYELSSKELLRYFLISSTSLFLLGYLFYKNILISSVLTLASRPFQSVWEQYLAERRREALSVQFRDLLYGLSASVSAGRQLPEALKEAGAQLEECYGKEAVLCREVSYMTKSIDESRQEPESLLKQFAERSRTVEIRQFVQICAICRRTGGDMERIIGKTAAVLMEKLAVKREIQMVTAQKRLEARILTAMPIAMVLALNLLSPDYLSALYAGFGGRLIMTAALAGIAAAYGLCQKITEIDV